MGVLSERIFAVFLALAGTPRSHAAALETVTPAAPKEHPTPAPTISTSRLQSPSSSVLRADLEAMRMISRMR